MTERKLVKPIELLWQSGVEGASLLQTFDCTDIVPLVRSTQISPTHDMSVKDDLVEAEKF
jgi:hypothetical protein